MLPTQTSVTITGAPKGYQKSASTFVTPESFIESLDVDIFKNNLKGAPGVLDQMIALVEKLPTQDKIEMLENAYSKLDFLNDELKNSGNPAVDPGNFQASVALVEAGLLSYINTLDSHHEEKNARIFEKISALKFSQNSENTTDIQKILMDNSAMYRSMHLPQSSVIVNAKGEKFIQKGFVKSDGNCGLGSIYVNTDRTGLPFDKILARKHLVECKNAHEQLARAANDPKVQVTATHLKAIFGEFSNCQAFVDQLVQERINLPDLKNRASFELMQGQIRSAANYSDIANNNAVISFISRNVAFEFSKNTHIDGDYLTNGDVEADMLSKGYLCVDRGIAGDDNKAPESAQTVMEFKHLTTGNKEYIANNSKPLSQHEAVTQKTGSHWVPLEKVRQIPHR